MLELQATMSQNSAEPDSVEDNSCEEQEDLEDEMNDLIVAIAGALAVEAINGDHAAVRNEDERSDEDRYPCLWSVTESANICWEESAWMRDYMGLNLLYSMYTLRQTSRLPRTLCRRLRSDPI